MNKFVFLFLAFFHLSLQMIGSANFAYAGGRVVGNGGDVFIVTEKNSKISYHLADFYMNRSEDMGIWKNGRYNFEMGEPHLQLNDKIKIVLDRISKFSPGLARTYHDFIFFEFLSSNPFVPGPLINIADEYFSWDSSMNIAGIQIQQLALQLNGDIKPSEKRFFVDQTYFQKIPIEHQLGLLLHEAVYQDLFRRRQEQGTVLTSSNDVRKLVAIYSGRLLQSWSDFEFILRIRFSGFKWIDFKGCNIRLFSQLKPVKTAFFTWQDDYIAAENRERWNLELSGLKFDEQFQLIEARSYSGRKMRFSKSGQLISGPCEKSN